MWQRWLTCLVLSRNHLLDLSLSLFHCSVSAHSPVHWAGHDGARGVVVPKSIVSTCVPRSFLGAIAHVRMCVGQQRCGRAPITVTMVDLYDFGGSALFGLGPRATLSGVFHPTVQEGGGGGFHSATVHILELSSLRWGCFCPI